MYKAAVIGDSGTVAGFAALGLTAIPADTSVQAGEALKKLLSDGETAVIYITEQLFAQLGSAEALATDPNVAIIPIPSARGNLGLGEAQLHRAVERAVGADILKEKDE